MSRRLSFPSSLHPSLIALALLLIYAYLQFSSLAVTSITLDEPSHLAAGYAFLTRGDTRIKLNGPMLPNLIGAIPLLLQPDLKLTPPADPMWDANDHNGISDEFVWRNTVSPFRLIYLARFPYLVIGWLLGALIFRWAQERGGARAGVFALTLFVFDPNLLAHSRFVMTDFAPTAMACFTLYALDRSLRQPHSRKWLIIAGCGLGLALASKFSLIMLAVAAFLLFATQELSRAGSHARVSGGVGAATADAASANEGSFGFGGKSGMGMPDLRILRRSDGIPMPSPRETRKTPNELARGNSSRLRAVAVRFFSLIAIAAFTVWGVYAFQIGPVEQGGRPVPAPGFWREWQSAQYYLTQPWPNYLFGRTSTTGWWYYFPIALLVKTPLPILILFVVALARTFIKRTWRADAILLAPMALIFISLLFSANNLGYRYLLPLLPLSFIYIARSLSPSLHLSISPSFRHLVILSLLGWLILGTLAVSPYTLTYFNELAGGPERGRFILSDSNIDWGQDLVGLKNYVEQNHLDRVKLSYFGIAHPTAYDLATEALPPVRTAMNDQGAWWLKKFNPLDPAPGVYAISVANLMGGIWIDPAAFAFFRDRAPDTTIGHSIYLYTIAPRGEAADLSLAGVQIDQIDAATYRRFNTNDVRPRWFEAASSLIAAPGESWIAIADDQSVAPEFQGLFAGVEPITRTQLTDEDRTYALYHFDLGQRLLDAAHLSSTSAAVFGDTATLIGYQIDRVGADLTLITTWRAGDHIATPLQMFVHALDASGAIVAQADRLDASPFGWRAGDVIAQVHRLKISAEAPEYQLAIGLYNPATNERLPVMINDQVRGDHFTLNEAQP